MKELKPINKLSPCLVSKIWGGEKLVKFKKMKQAIFDSPIGESWEISVHPDGPCFLDNVPLNHYISSECLPYLVKFIDTADNLSVQVHPDNEYAMMNERSVGKTECWIILDCAPSSGIYLGIKQGVTRKRFENAIMNNEDISQLLNFYETHRGDFFFVPAGTVHAIGKDVLLCEIQQNSGITYRVWDWNRLDDNGRPRDLHINKAMEVIAFDEELNSNRQFQIRKDIFKGHGQKIAKHTDFEIDYYAISDDIQINALDNKRMNSCICLEGSFEIIHGSDHEFINEWETALLNPRLKYSINSKAGCKILWIG